MGKWGDPIEFGIVPVAVANLPNGNLLTWSSQFRDTFIVEGDGMTFTELFDPKANNGLGASLGEFTSNTDHDMFCPGINNLADGRILSAGGTSSERTSIYDWRTNSWTVADEMNIPRGYQGNVTLSDGSVFTVGGSWSGGNYGNRDAEIYSSLTGWLKLPNIQGEDIYVNEDLAMETQGNYRTDNHVWLWPAPNGKLFHAGPSERMHWIDVDVPGGSIVDAGKRQDSGAGVSDGYSMKGNTVMFDIGKILKTGGAPAYGADYYGTTPARDNSFIIDINGTGPNPAPTVTFTGNMSLARTMHNSTVLPTGEVLITGGLQKAAVFTDDTAVLGAQIFNPYDSGNKWSTVAAMSIPRTYHSVAILMVDGRVFVGGGGLCDGLSLTQGCTNHMNAEIYSPPYLFKSDNTLAERPEIIDGPESSGYDTTINVEATPGIQQFSLIRFSAATHSTNNEQRRIPVNFTTSGNSYDIEIPNRELLPPGYYMLFAIDNNGVPSIAHTIKIGSEIPLSNNSNLVLDMQFDESTGTIVPDNSQYGNHGTIIQRDDNGDPVTANQHSWPEGIIGNALEFDGLEFTSNSLLEIDYSEELASTANSITLSAWVYRNSNSVISGSGKVANVGIFSQSYPNMFFGFHNTLYKWAFSTEAEALNCYSGYAPLNTWVHLAATYDGNTAILYANGVEVCRRQISGPIKLVNDNSDLSKFTASGFYEDGSRNIPVTYGGNDSGITDEISGKIDLLKVYNKVLEPAEIQALYNEGFDTNNPQITNCNGNYLTVQYKIGANGSPIQGTDIVVPEGSEVYIKAANATGEYYITTTQYDGPTISSLDSTKMTADGYYRLDTSVDIIAIPPWNNPNRNDGFVDTSNVGQFVVSTPTGCQTTINLSLLEDNQEEGCPNYLPNGDPSIFITSGALNTGLDEANGTNIETNGSECALEIINNDSDNPWARFTVTINLQKFGIQAGDELYLELDGKGNNNAAFEVVRDNSNANPPIGSYTFTQNWTTFKGSIIVPGNTQTLDLWLYSNYSKLEPGTAYFDNLKVINLTATNGNRPPTAEFTATPLTGDAPLNVSFNANASTDEDGTVNQYVWKFGDNTTSNVKNPSHLYNTPGTYLVSLTVFDDGGLRDEKTTYITVLDTGNQSPVAVAEANVTSGNAPLTVQFTGSNSTGDGPLSYAWDFADGGTSTLEQPEHIFTTGTYTVSLTVTDGSNATDTDTITITVNDPPNQLPQAVIDADPISGSAPLEVQFTGDNSNDDGPLTYTWNFDDGATSTLDNPTHIFTNSGTFDVTLTVTDEFNETDSETITITVNDPPNQIPQAVIDADPISGSAPLEVQFTGDNSTDDGPLTYTWNFDDGATSTLDNPTHIFTNSGTFDVTLTVTDEFNETDSETITITVNDAANQMPVAVIEADPISGSAPLEVQFTGSNSTDDGTLEYAWDFDDGATSTLDNPTHIFTNIGTFDVTLTVTDEFNETDSETITITVNDATNQMPVAVIEADPISGSTPLEVQFTGSNSTDDGTLEYAWDFDDGATSTLDNPTHIFTNSGTFDVTLMVTDEFNETDSETITITVNDAANQMPVAVIEADPISGSAPLEVQFTGSNSTDDGTLEYAWDFDDGATSTLDNPTHIFTNSGTFDVTLTVTDEFNETDSEAITITVNDTANQMPQAVIDANPISGNAPLDVQFSASNSTDDDEIVSYIWSFDDGNTASGENVSHTFQTIKDYEVTLTVTDSNGASDTESIIISVNDLDNQPPVAKIEANPLSGNAPLLIEFSGGSSTDDNGIVSYEWNFGDGTTSNEIDVNHSYEFMGEYLVTLTVTDVEGLTNEKNVTIFVNESSNQAPVAILDTDLTEGGAPLTVEFIGSNSTDDTLITTYEWDFGNGENAENANVQYTYNTPGVYTVALTVTDSEGLTDTTSTIITVNEGNIDCSAKLIDTYYSVNNGDQELNATTVIAFVGDDLTLGLQPNNEMFTVTGPLNKELNVLPLVIENAQISNSGIYTLQTEDGCSFIINVQITLNETLNNASIDDIIIYPNPVRGETLKIELSKFMNEGINIGFYDIYGKLVFQKMIKNDHEEIYELDLSTLSRGMYLMEIIKTSNDNSTIKKVIKIE
ncbi:PKD domain-containing protein [Maribacter sp. MAR_2009_72]|uniref:PKD domain-containing protein n=1 Tax=Maribacter sp. MAR_2009_72 TaxID=1250050 RepID=UPI001C942C9D|nr:PKD domain-containing protein [Maribacter sp. MAR_2009_72]